MRQQHNISLFLFNMAVADAYGAGFEFKPQEFVDQNNNLTTYFKHGKDDIPEGNYTDDTQMTLALCEHIINDQPFSPLAIAESFLYTFNNDRRLGYASGFQKFLENCKSAEDFIHNIKPDSTRNGAAMRAIPCGFLSNVESVLFAAEAQAKLTHDTPEGIASAQAIALLAYFLHHKKMNMYEAIVETSHCFNYSFLLENEERVKCDAIQTVQAVFTVLKYHENLADILKESVAFGGDTDSVAALAVGLGSLCPDIEQNLPQHLQENLEGNHFDGAFSRSYLKYIGEEMLANTPCTPIK